MDVFKLIIILIVIVGVLKLRKPLYIAMVIGTIATIILYNIPIQRSLTLIKKGITSKDTINLVLAFYTITFIQRMMEKRGHLILAEKSLSNIFNSRRLNAMVAPFIIGILPSAGAVLIAAPIVDNAAGDSLTVEEKTFVTSYYRHIPEVFLPTYSSILLALDLSGVNMGSFVLAMIPLVFVLFFLGYIFYVKKIPKNAKVVNKNMKKDILNLFKTLWAITFVIVIVLTFNVKVYMATIPVILIFIIVNKFNLKELHEIVVSAFEVKLILSTIMIMIFKEVLVHTNVIYQLPKYFEKLPINIYLVFSLVFLFGTLIVGSQGMIALALPLTYIAIPDGGVPLLVLVMSMTFISMQFAPTHICLSIVVEKFKVPFFELIKKTLPIGISFILITYVYVYFLKLVM